MKMFEKPMAKSPCWVMMRAVLTTAIYACGYSNTHAGEADAKKLLKDMSNYVASQKAISFSYDAGLEVTTRDEQKLLCCSGEMVLNRPDKMRFSRSGGFADIEGVFDGKTITLFGKNANAVGVYNC